MTHQKGRKVPLQQCTVVEAEIVKPNKAGHITRIDKNN